MDDVEGWAELLKALADATRVRIFAALVTRGDTCVCELAELVGTTPSNLSFHLNKLKAAELIQGRKVGKWMFYRPNPDAAGRAREWLGTLLDTSCTPQGPVEGSIAAICCGRDVPLSLKEVTLRTEEGELVAERM